MEVFKSKEEYEAWLDEERKKAARKIQVVDEDNQIHWIDSEESNG